MGAVLVKCANCGYRNRVPARPRASRAAVTATSRCPGSRMPYVMAILTLMVLRHGQVAAQRAGAVSAASLRAWVGEVLGN